MKKRIILLGLTIILIMSIITTTFVYAANEDVTLEKVKDNVCTIKLGEDGEVIKQLLTVDNENKEATLQIDVKNLKSEDEAIKPTEIFLVIDNSKSMSDNTLADGRTRKEAVFTAAKSLTDKIIQEQPTTKIGIVSFSSNSDTTKEGTLEDANLVIMPTNNATDITTAIDGIATTGVRTNIDAGLQIAKTNFSTDEGVNRHLILLTDGVPNNSVGTSMAYSGATATNTKATLQSLVDSNINIITVMTGVDSTYQPDPDGNLSAEAAGKTYRDLAEEIFGTQAQPNYGKFYYVSDESVEDTITEDVYNDVKIVIKNEIKNIILVDYFPTDIIENYDFEIVEKANIGTVTPTVNTDDNSITWTIQTLKAGETASFKYKLKLKEQFNREIINVETPTNEKVDVSYTGTDENTEKQTSNVSPSIILKQDTAPDPIPQTGDNTMIIALAIIGLVTVAIIGIAKYRNK